MQNDERDVERQRNEDQQGNVAANAALAFSVVDHGSTYRRHCTTGGVSNE